jgi:hypothetical protein
MTGVILHVPRTPGRPRRHETRRLLHRPRSASGCGFGQLEGVRLRAVQPWLAAPRTSVSPDTRELAPNEGPGAAHDENVDDDISELSCRFRAGRWRRGSVDSHELDLAARQLIADEASIIFVDLGGVRFIGSDSSRLSGARVQQRRRPTTDDRRPMVRCGPSPMALRVIRMTGLEDFARVHTELPPVWPYYAGDPEPASRRRKGLPSVTWRPLQSPRLL